MINDLFFTSNDSFGEKNQHGPVLADFVAGWKEEDAALSWLKDIRD